jgi:DNA-binding transcriptional MerR regulator/methylmalonyl-CoA mutase cobalamin-binding subunit
MYTIKQAASRTGLSVPTIRAWEQRYGVVVPARTAAGYRLYDDAAIERLAAMRSLVEIDGWRPSQAAERVATPGLDLSELAHRGARPQPAPRDGRLAVQTEMADGAIAEFVAAAGILDVDRMESVLDEAFAAQRFELAVQSVVFPALRAVGLAWAEGELDVASEHAASETVRRRLSRYFDAAQGPSVRARVLIGMPPAGQHELGAFAFAVACRRAGEGVAYLGKDVPVASWLRMASETAVPAIALGAVTREDAIGVDLVVAAIQTMDRPPVCFAGGPASLDVPLTSGAVQLPSSLDDAVAAVAAVTASAERRSPR